MAKKKTDKKKSKTIEVFGVEKKGKEKVIEKRSEVETPIIKKGQKEHQDKILKIVMFSIIGLILISVIGYFFINSLKTSNYDGVEFSTISEGNLIFYKTTVMTKDKNTNVANNIYLRTKPSDLKKIPFPRKDFNLMKVSAYNFTSDFSCDEYKTIGIANINNLHQVLGMQLLRDVNSTCDPQGRYAYYSFVAADKTQIKRVGNNCYSVEVANCNLLPAIDKLTAEMILKYNSM